MTTDIKRGMAYFKKRIEGYFKQANDPAMDPDTRYYNMRDFADMRYIYELIEMDQIMAAAKKARSLDTAVREEIPNSVWRFLMDNKN
jgi:hypothetical protein